MQSEQATPDEETHAPATTDAGVQDPGGDSAIGKEESFLRSHRYGILLAGVLALSAFLNIWNIWNQGITNEYYAAAVKSMLENPRMLLFNAFDAAGFVTVDKPPGGLWVQVASAALLGFSGWSLVLPQALAGVASVALVWFIVSKPFGKPAGLVSALALAVTPIFVAVSRNGTMDGILIFVLLLALAAGLRAARDQSLPWLVLAVALTGVGFNIKMAQALIVVPAIIGAYLLGTAGTPAKTRVLHLVIAGIVLSAVSLSWAAAVDSIPPDQRPYIGGSGDNTVLGLIVNYNGLHRLEDGMGSTGGPAGMVGPDMGNFSGPAGGSTTGFTPGNMPSPPEGGMPPDRGSAASGNRTALPGGADGAAPGQGPLDRSAGMVQPGSTGGGAPGRGGMDNTGSPGPFRLFGEGLAAQISWLLVFALIGLLAWAKRPVSLSWKGFADASLTGERGITLAAICLWLLPGLAYFSFTTGFWHTYYLATIAPPLAALAGIGAVAMYRAYRSGGPESWLLVAAVPLTGFVQVLFLLYDADWAGVFIPLFALAIVSVTGALVFLKLRQGTGSGGLPGAAAFLAIALLFIAPSVWACTPVAYGTGGVLPTAGPDLQRGGGMGRMNGPPGSGGDLPGLASYLVSHNTGETWLAAAASSNAGAASLITETGYPVMSIGGFAGSDRILSTERLEELIRSGEIRYFLVQGSSPDRGGASGNGALYSWIEENCTVVPSLEYGGSTGAEDPGTSPGMFPGGAAGIANLTGRDLKSGGARSGTTLYDCGCVVAG